MGEGGNRGRLAFSSLLLLEHAVFFVVACRTFKIFRARGFRGIYSATFRALRNLPGVEAVIQRFLNREVEGAVRRMHRTHSQIARERRPMLRLPHEGIAGEELLAQLEVLKEHEKRLMDEGKSFGYAYTNDHGNMNDHCKLLLQTFKAFCAESGANDMEHDRILDAAFQAFVCENGINPTNPALVPAVRKCENEVVAMTASLFHADDEVVGSLTSGTQESILLAVKTYRDMARATRPQITEPEMIVPVTAHPAFIKAGQLFDIRVVVVPVGPDSRVSLEAVETALTPATILLVASAPQYPHGVLDPIQQLGDMALENDLFFHVDACFGGMLLPFLEKLGQDIQPWDFRCRGVSSISADLHKYGYCIKGTGIILYRNSEIREYQYFTYLEWPGGTFGSPSLVGTRPAGNVAASWVSMMSLGETGYLRLARACIDVAERLKDGVRNIAGLGLVAEPDFVSLAIVSRDVKVDILLVGDAMEERGWWMERQQHPPSLHLSVMAHHKDACDRLLLDLRACVENVRRRGTKAIKRKGRASIYTGIASLPDRSLLSDFIKKMYGETHRLSPSEGMILSASAEKLQKLLGEGEEEEEEEEDEEEEDENEVISPLGGALGRL